MTWGYSSSVSHVCAHDVDNFLPCAKWGALKEKLRGSEENNIKKKINK